MILVSIVLGVIPALGWWVALTFLFGAVTSGLAGFIGMSIAVRANSRTAAAAKRASIRGSRFPSAPGAVMGLCVSQQRIVGLSIIFFAFQNNPDFLKIIPAFASCASSVDHFRPRGRRHLHQGRRCGR